MSKNIEEHDEYILKVYVWGLIKVLVLCLGVSVIFLFGFMSENTDINSIITDGLYFLLEILQKYCTVFLTMFGLDITIKSYLNKNTIKRKIIRYFWYVISYVLFLQVYFNEIVEKFSKKNKPIEIWTIKHSILFSTLCSILIIVFLLLKKHMLEKRVNITRSNGNINNNKIFEISSITLIIIVYMIIFVLIVYRAPSINIWFPISIFTGIGVGIYFGVIYQFIKIIDKKFEINKPVIGNKK